MSEWANVVVYPLGLCGFALFLIWRAHVRAEQARQRGQATSTPVVLYGFAGLALIAGIGLAYIERVVPGDTQEETRRKKGPEQPPQVTTTSVNNDAVALREFKWRLQNAMNTWASTGDFTAVLNLSVDKYNAISYNQQRQMEQMRLLWPHLLAQAGASILVTIDSWDIDWIRDDEASVRYVFTTSGQQMGIPGSETVRGNAKLAKVRGEWLLASGGTTF